jgi:hypothetical protein
MGEIKETIGNMIALDLIERIEIPEMTDEEMADMRERFAAGADGAGRGELTEEERAAMRERFSLSGDNAGEGRQFVYGEGDLPEGFAEGFPDGMPDGFAERFAEGFPEGMPDGFTEGARVRGRNYTGESKDIIIPAGAPVLESTYTNGEQVESEISLDKLKVCDIIEVTYASDGETVAKVIKQSSPQGIGRIRIDESGNGDSFGGVAPGGEGYTSPIMGVRIPTD